MLPKCTLPSKKWNGRHGRLTPVDSLCNMWVDNNVITLWEMAKNRAQVLQSQHRSNLSNTHKRHIDLAVSYGLAGMLGKACKILTSSGLAPNNETTWNLLLSKDPASQLPSIPEITQEPVSLGSDFNILCLKILPKGYWSRSFRPPCPTPVGCILHCPSHSNLCLPQRGYQLACFWEGSP